ncbi:palmitoyl-(protein) hydrolase [Aureococcus anophagefferens]|nr:palmitoyl-(protein) hydrolase [Aureococcus anophagefferens]
MWAVLLMAAAAAGLLATEGRTAQQIEAVAAALLAVDDLNAAYASDNITFTLAAAWGDYDVDVVACAACPEGAVCRGYAYAPYNEKNYWADPANPAVVQECYNDGQCKRKFRCFEAYEGRACTEVRTHEYFLLGGALELKCPSTFGARLALTVSLVLVAVAVWIFFNSLVLAECELFDILLSYVQTVAIISSFHISWPKHARYLFVPAVLARFWSFERFRSPLHFWYIVLKWRSILICAITTLDDGAVQLFCGSAVIACVIAVEQTLSLLFRPYEKTLLNGVDTAGFVLVAAFASSTIVLFSDEAHRFKQTWLVSVVAFVVAAFGAVAVHEVLAKRDRLFKQAATQETKRRALHHHGRSSPSSRDAPKHAAEGGRRVDPELLLDAVAELSDTLCGKPWHAFVTDPDTSDAVWDDCRDASLAIRPFVCDASPTSRYSADARACYWRLFCKARPRRRPGARTDVAGRRPSYGLQDLATPGGVSSSLAAVQDQVSGHANEHHAKQHKTTVEDCEKVEVRAVLLSHVVTKKDADDEAPVVVVDDEMPEALGEVAVEVARCESRRALVPYPESLGAFFCASRDDPVVGIYACGD